jgi:heme exporter protein C
VWGLKHWFQPKTVLRWVCQVQPWVGWLALVTLAIGVGDALLISPPDYQQGELVRIMYVHVPAAWWALALYALMALMSLIYVLARLPLASAWAEAMAPIGMGLCAASLITGAIWGKPTWGTWWVWDARLTSMLLLFVLYVGYVSLGQSGQFDEQRRRMASVAAIVGAINLPIIKFSVNWWHTLHQPASVWRLASPAIDSSLLRPLLIMALGYGLLAGWLILWRLPRVWRQYQTWVALMSEVAQ